MAKNLTYEEQRSAVDKVKDGEVKERVLRGLALLREEHGEGWVERIDPELLDMRDGSVCILGQLYGGPDSLEVGFWRGLRLIGGPVQDDPSAYGFNAEPIRGDAEDEYRKLDELWLAAIGSESE